MSNEQMRTEVSQVYGPRARAWIGRVEKMREGQVVAVYYSFKKRGLLK